MNTELAKRAVNCKHWRWIDGMLTTDDVRCFRIERTRNKVFGLVIDGVIPFPKESLPDLDDPATLGCLLALVREAQGDCTIWTMVDVDCEESAWICTGLEVGEIGSGYSEAHALVAALEAAP
jgi:hypothetical protein